MLTITDRYTASLPYPYEKLGNPPGLLFFDIETTGLSARTSQLYLIGSLFTDGTVFYLRQWFAQEPSDEKAVLAAFREELLTRPDGCLLLHFNGNGFDLPYLRKKYEHFSLPFPLDRFQSMDLYRSLRPFQAVLGLASLRQKAVETYLNLTRTDPFDGGQLIPVYENYLRTRSEADRKTLLLHNSEDVRNMPGLLAALKLGDYMEAHYSLTGQKYHTVTALDGSEKVELLVTLCCPVALPRPISLRLDCGPYLTAAKNRISLAVPLCEQTLKHYFSDTKNYFYLPDEDRAVHKSVGIYVDRDHRLRATKDNCYARKSGVFLPCPAGMKFQEKQASVFQRDRKEKTCYLEWNGEDSMKQTLTEEFWNAYVQAMWRSRR